MGFIFTETGLVQGIYTMPLNIVVNNSPIGEFLTSLCNGNHVL